MFPNRTAVPEAPVALTAKPVPGVEKTTPRGEFTLKKFAGKEFGAENPSGTPSQLISRRPLPNEPAVFGFSVPSVARNASTCVWIDAAVAPPPATMDWACPVAAAARSASVAPAARANLRTRECRDLSDDWGMRDSTCVSVSPATPNCGAVRLNGSGAALYVSGAAHESASSP